MILHPPPKNAGMENSEIQLYQETIHAIQIGAALVVWLLVSSSVTNSLGYLLKEWFISAKADAVCSLDRTL